jgi:hypothetical protein
LGYCILFGTFGYQPLRSRAVQLFSRFSSVICKISFLKLLSDGGILEVPVDDFHAKIFVPDRRLAFVSLFAIIDGSCFGICVVVGSSDRDQSTGSLMDRHLAN